MDILFVFIIGIIVLLTAVLVMLYYTDKILKTYANIHSCVINLPRRRDRLVNFQKHYTLPVDYTVIDAVDGKDINVDQLYEQKIIGEVGKQSLDNTKNGIGKKYHYELSTPGAVGCSLSHIRIWKSMVEKNIELMFVFEDDAWVVGMDMNDIMQRLADLPSDWHVYMLGQPHTLLEGIPVKERLYRITRFCGTHAYVINLKGAKWLLENGQLFPINQQIDAHMAELAWRHGFNIYLHMNMPMISPFGAGSDIQVQADNIGFNRLALS